MQDNPPLRDAQSAQNTGGKVASTQMFSQLYREYSGRVLASLTRKLGDLSLAEEAMHDAFVLALEKWTDQNIPANPVAWLISTAMHKAIDLLRRKQKLGSLSPTLALLAEHIQEHNEAIADRDIEDDQLRLIFTCCHPAIAADIQIPLTLREVCGLSTEDIAHAFLVPTATMAQRIVRGKKKIRHAKVPFQIPSQDQIAERINVVLSVIYLVYNEGYSASSGENALRAELSREAIRLARLVNQLLPTPEAQGLLALMLLQEARRDSRIDSNGDIILLEQQDRKRWDRVMIAEGEQLVEKALKSKHLGYYTLQAAIAAVHANAAVAADTDWAQIVALYSLLYRIAPSPVVALNRAVALAMRDNPQAGLDALEALKSEPSLQRYHLYHATRAELLNRNGQTTQALEAFTTALSFCEQAPERRLLQQKLSALKNS